MKKVIMVCHMLTDPKLGIHTVWTYYDDGSVETHQAPMGAILVPPPPITI